MLLDPLLQTNGVLIVFTLAVMIAAWHGGFWPGLFATLLSVLVGEYLFVPPRYSFFWLDPADTVRLLVLAAVCTGISLIGGRLRTSQAQALESEERFRLLIEGVSDVAICALDTDGCIRTWNTGLARLERYSAAEITGKHIAIVYTPEDIAAGRPERLLQDAVERGSATDEGWRVRRDGTRYWAEVSVTALHDSRGQLRGFSYITRDITERHEHLADLERSEETMRSLLASAAQAIVAVDAEGRIQFANAMAEQLFGAAAMDLLNTPVEPILPLLPFRSEDSIAVHAGPVQSGLQVTARRRDGSMFPAEVNLSRLQTRQGTLLVAFISDIADRKRAEEELRRSEQHVRNVLDSLFAFVSVLTPDGVLVEANRPPLEAGGLSREQVIGVPLWETAWWSHSPDIQDQLRQAVRQAKLGISSRYDTEIRLRDGETTAVDLMLTPMRDEDGRITQLIASGVPIADRKRAEQALRQSEARLRRITESGIIGVLEWDLDGSVLNANEAFLSMLGFTRSELQAGTIDWRALTPPEWAEADARGVAQLLERGTMDAFEKEFFHKDGRRVPVLLTAATFDGTPRRGVTLALDISEQKRAQRALLESEERFRNLADHAPVMIWMTESDGSCSYLNRSWYEFTGQTPETGLGFGWLDAVHPDDKEASAEAFRHASKYREPFRVDYRLRNREGEYRWAIDAAAPRFAPGGTFLGHVGSVIDISERKMAEETIRASEERLRTVLEAAPALVWVCSIDGDAVYFNRGWREYTGMTEEESKGFAWTRAIHPQDVQRCLEVWGNARRQGLPYEVEVRYRRYDGTYRWHLARALLGRDAGGTGKLWFGMSTDIEDQKQAEIRLRRTNEDLKQFAWAASHDLQEPLRMVVTFTQLVERRYADRLDQEGREFMRYSVEGAQRIEAMLAGLREYWQARERSERPPVPVDLNSPIEEAVGNLGAAIAETGARVTREKMPTVFADHVPMVQLFQNLLGNAIKYRHAERSPQIHISAQPVGDEWQLCVEDNGIGISEEYRQQVFRIFKRLHARHEYDGTGIGLALCQTIVERYGGKIWVESTANGGSRFCFTLPAPDPART
jgi:two-component system CheB/CheR fusion protein